VPPSCPPSRREGVDRITKRLIPNATHRRWGKRAWDARRSALHPLLSSWKARELPYRWGLPKKAFYTSGEVAEIVGVTWEQLRYAIELGHVTDCEGGDEQGHRRWTEAEVERTVLEFGVEQRGHLQ
jgi:hypothetical protein